MSRRSRLIAAIWDDRPKNHSKENARRLRQIAAGKLRGQFIDDDARLHALGLTAPGDIRLIESPTDNE